MMNEKLQELLDQKKYVAFIHELDQMNSVDAAEFVCTLDLAQQAMVFRLLKKDMAVEIFAELDSDMQEQLITTMTDKEITVVMERLFIDDAVDMLEELPAGMVHRILKNTPSQLRSEINRFLMYDENQVGSIMTPEFISVYSNMSVSQAVEYIRKNGGDKETIYVIYVTDSAKVLLGTIELKDLLFSEPTTLISDLMVPNVPTMQTNGDKEEAAAMISKYDLLALPIVDSESRLVGIVTVDDAVDVIHEEATEDIERMAAILPSDQPYLKVGVFSTYFKRIPWLLLLMITATITGSILSHYEAQLGTMIVLTTFIPMLMDTGGNAGSQASATIIRGLSLGEIKLRNILKILWKEMRVSLLCGITLSLLVYLKALFWDSVSHSVALVVALTVLATVSLAKLVGASLPIFAKSIGLDPAVMAGPFITTIIDTLALLLYFGIAGFILAI